MDREEQILAVLEALDLRLQAIEYKLGILASRQPRLMKQSFAERLEKTERHLKEPNYPYTSEQMNEDNWKDLRRLKVEVEYIAEALIPPPEGAANEPR